MVELKRKSSGDLIFSLDVGRRASCNGHHGTVCYIGEVPPTKGVWIGIDWDYPSRGKHDGTHNGVRYFTTRFPKSGSFVRPEKLDFGCSIVEAIRKKYGTPQNEEELAKAQETIKEVQRSINAPFIETVGFDKVEKNLSRLEDLERVSLYRLEVNGPGPLPELQLLCPKITELDLSHTLIHSWESVAAISAQLAHLSTLSLSDNRILLPEDPKQLKPAFDSLHTMVLVKCGYTWPNILLLSQMWPRIKCLNIPFNYISEVSEPVETLQDLQSLDLQGNPLESWAAVECFSKLKYLNHLNVAHTNLQNIVVSHNSEARVDYFPALKCLNITRNPISEWQSVSELNKLPQLEELRFLNCPLLNNHVNTPETTRQFIIARIANLKVFNGRKILPSERRGAEYDYINLHGGVWQDAIKTDQIKERFLAFHPRYLELIEKYGPPETQDSKKESGLITLKLCKEDEAEPTCIRKFPSSMLVHRLVGYVQRLYNIGQQPVILSYISSKNPDQEITLDNNFKSLSYYSVSDGDKIIIRW